MTDGFNQSHCANLTLLAEFSTVYAPIHAYLALTVCVFGSATNFLNAIVLVQKSMRSPTNALLTGIALVDSITMINYGIHTIYLYMLTSPDPTKYAHGSFAVKLLLLQHVVSIGSHTISTVLLVELAAFRCWILYTVTAQCSVPRGSSRAASGCVSRATQRRVATGGLVGACLAGVLMAAPAVFIYTVAPTNSTESHAQLRHMHYSDEANETHWSENNSNPILSRKQSYWFNVRSGAEPLESAHFVLYGCFVKILASILICVLTTFILIAMEIANRRYMRLQNLSSKGTMANSASRYLGETKIDPVSQRIVAPDYSQDNQGSDEQITQNHERGYTAKNNEDNQRKHSLLTHRELPVNGETQIGDRLGKKRRQGQRATIMLIVVVVSFVITEAPQGVVNTLVAVKGECFHSTVYMPLGDVLDLAVLLNSSINFILYCSMSQMFRANFARLICQLCPCMCTRLVRFGSTRSRARTNSWAPASKNPLVVMPHQCSQYNNKLLLPLGRTTPAHRGCPAADQSLNKLGPDMPRIVQ